MVKTLKRAWYPTAKFDQVRRSLGFLTPRFSIYCPLSPPFPDFSERRFWRLPGQLGVVLAMLMERVPSAESKCSEVELARGSLGPIGC